MSMLPMLSNLLLSILISLVAVRIIGGLGPFRVGEVTGVPQQ